MHASVCLLLFALRVLLWLLVPPGCVLTPCGCKTCVAGSIRAGRLRDPNPTYRKSAAEHAVGHGLQPRILIGSIHGLGALRLHFILQVTRKWTHGILQSCLWPTGASESYANNATRLRVWLFGG
jgi:hypothetical protein